MDNLTYEGTIIPEPSSLGLLAAGLLGLDLPPDFSVPDPSAAAADEDLIPLDSDPPEFHTDFLGGDEDSQPS